MMRKKTGGRKAGTPNKFNRDFREQISSFIEKNWCKVQIDFDSLQPKERIQFIEKLLKYTTPALSNAKNEIAFENLSDEMLDELIKKIIK